MKRGRQFRAGLLKRCPAEQRRLTWLAASVKTSESEPEMWRHFHTALDPPHRNECDELLIDFARTFSNQESWQNAQVMTVCWQH